MSEASTTKPVTKEAIKKKSNDECIELKNIKYQTMLINNNMDLSRKKETTNISNIEDFLMKEREYNKKQPWSKLGEGSKMKKLTDFISDYSVKNNLSEQDKKQLTRYLKRCMERKKLQRVRDVQYNIELGKIISIPGLLFIEKKQKYTLKNTDKKGSTLKSLAPKKRIRKKIRKKDKVKTKDNEEDKKNKNNK